MTGKLKLLAHRISFITILLTICYLLIAVNYCSAQKFTLKGNVKDDKTGETLIGANVLIGGKAVAVTDTAGNFTLKLDKGEYTLTVSYVGYKSEEKKIKLNSNISVDFLIQTKTLTEIEVVADEALSRETPVAFTTINQEQLSEELATQDIPMVLNNVPGVYATQQGGGDGDARITIRGFDQSHIAVLLDGVPVNDMEDGAVYWSDWPGLDLVTKEIQVVRGLGASQLAIPSFGGTINIITKGFDNRKEINVKEETGSDGLTRTTVEASTGQLGHGFSMSVAGSYKANNGWVDETYSKAWFWYGKINKKIGRHLISLSGLGAPQQHDQRSYQQGIATYDSQYAEQLGVSSEYIPKQSNYGLQYNQEWGYIRRWRNNLSDTAKTPTQKLNSHQNYYNKPQYNLRDYWNVNDKLYITNNVYLSTGTGGGIGPSTALSQIPGVAGGTDAFLTAQGQINWQYFYNENATSINKEYSGTLKQSQEILKSEVDNHIWYGDLSTFKYNYTSNLTFSGGIDVREYEGIHYEQVTDLLGGDYFVDTYDVNQTSAMKTVGDKMYYDNNDFVKRGGLFWQGEYHKDKFSIFLSASGTYNGYMRQDPFMKEIKLKDTTLLFTNTTDPIKYQGVTYTKNSPGQDYAQTLWKWIPDGTVKLGGNYNVSRSSNFFINVGYLSNAPLFNSVYNNYNILYGDIKNETIQSAEAGYCFSNKQVALNVNVYYTVWDNKPTSNPITYTDPKTGTEYSASISGMNALEKGVEIAFTGKIGDNIRWEHILSVGDWRWTTKDSVKIYADNGQLLTTKFLDAKGVHIGNAPQLQYGQRLRFNVFKDFFVTIAATYFADNYAQFDPTTLNGTGTALGANGQPKDSWEMPSYILVDLHTGYKFKYHKTEFELKGSILNLFNTEYIADADNNDQYVGARNPTTGALTNSYDAKSAGVFFGMGRRFVVSLQMIFK